jgi:hypothetical protein
MFSPLGVVIGAGLIGLGIIRLILGQPVPASTYGIIMICFGISTIASAFGGRLKR